MSTPYPPPPPQAQQEVPVRQRNGLGTAGFVVGLIGLIFSPIPLVGVVAWPLVIVGFVLSVIGLRRARNGAPNKGLSAAGVVCSAVGLLLCIMWAAAFGSAVDEELSSGAQGSQVSNNAGSQAGEGSGGQEQAQRSAGIGEPVRDGMFEFTVTKVETGISRVGNEYVGYDAQGQFVIVHLTVNNIGDEPRMLSMSSQKLRDVQGRTFSASTGAAVMTLPESEAFLTNINPGNSVRAKLLFDVPTDVRLAGIELHDSAFSGGVTVSLR